MLGIPTDVVDATEHLLQLADDLEPRRIDMGRVNGRYFLFSSGVGIDADVTRWVDDHPRLKARGGDATFTYAALRSYFRDYRGRPPLLEVQVGDQRVAGLSAIVQNSDPYTYFRKTPLRVCEDIAMDDGTISLTVMRRALVHARRARASCTGCSRASGRLAQHRQASSFPRIQRATCARSTAARCRSRSTATTSATAPRPCTRPHRPLCIASRAESRIVAATRGPEDCGPCFASPPRRGEVVSGHLVVSSMVRPARCRANVANLAWSLGRAPLRSSLQRSRSPDR